MAYINFDPQDYFNTKLYTGNGSTQSITGVGFQPDWVWIKTRNTTGQHEVFDAVRGATKYIVTNDLDPENTVATSLTSFDSDGFSLSSQSAVNNGSNTFVSWNWLGNGAGSSNTDGSITSTVSANTTSGFSIVTYTGNGTAGATVGHGLGATPKMMLIKQLNSSNHWRVYHSSLGATNVIYLNLADATDTGQGSVNFNNTAPSSSVFTLGTNAAVNGSGNTFVAYVFAEKKGYSKFGSYTGNGNADGTFIYTGFKPAFVLFKPSSAIENWQIHDNKRPSYNPCDNIAPNNNSAEADNDFVDLVSNGFKLRSATYSASGVTYIYMAFAEQPLINSLGNPATAR
jgi:hypothetical protein